MSFNDDPFSMVSPDISVEKSAECESWCKLTAKDFYLRQMASTPGYFVDFISFGNERGTTEGMDTYL